MSNPKLEIYRKGNEVYYLPNLFRRRIRWLFREKRIPSSYKLRTGKENYSKIQLREYLFNEVNGRCPFCKKEMLPSRIVYSDVKVNKENRLMHICHLYSKSKGGTNNINNLIGCCRKCNVEMGDKIITETKNYLVVTTKKL